MKRVPTSDVGLPSNIASIELPFDHDSYGWPGPGRMATNNPYDVQGNDHGGLTPEETVVPVAVYISKG